MPSNFYQSLVLISTTVFSFLLSQSSLNSYSLQIAASVFLLFYLVKKILKIERNRLDFFQSIIFTFIVTLTVNSTGGLNSPFFFLYYFLLFALGIFVGPFLSMSVSFTLVILLIATLPQANLDKSLIIILSLLLLTPFALFLGVEKKKNETLKTDSFLFLSLVLQNHLQTIKKHVENFMGDHDLEKISKNVRRMEKLIEKYENIT